MLIFLFACIYTVNFSGHEIKIVVVVVEAHTTTSHKYHPPPPPPTPREKNETHFVNWARHHSRPQSPSFLGQVVGFKLSRVALGTRMGSPPATASGNVTSMREPLDGGLWWYWAAANAVKKNGACFKNCHRLSHLFYLCGVQIRQSLLCNMQDWSQG